MSDALRRMRKTLTYAGGGDQHDRMVKDKYKSFQHALKYSYQATLANVRKVEEKVVRKCLINPDLNKIDYDDKIVSIDYKYGFKSGDVFQWMDNGTFWLIYSQELTELAYFRGDIRRAKYFIEWVDRDTSIKHGTWAYVRGPVETAFRQTFRRGITLDNPNFSLRIFMPNNEHTRKKFVRHERFLLEDVGWVISTVDTIAMDGIIELSAIELPHNEVTDDKGKNLVDAFKVKPVIVNEDPGNNILGPRSITPQLEEYTYTSEIPGGIWGIFENDYPIEYRTNPDNSFTVRWTSPKSGVFTIVYRVGAQSYTRNVIAESLF